MATKGVSTKTAPHWRTAALRASLPVRIFAAMLAGAAIAGPFEDVAATGFLGGHVTTARLLISLANEGNPSAQFALGNMYFHGDGVTQDYVQAHKWYNLAASRYPAADTEHRDEAVKNRDTVAAKMTPTEIAEAQKLAREWKPRPPTLANAPPVPVKRDCRHDHERPDTSVPARAPLPRCTQ